MGLKNTGRLVGIVTALVLGACSHKDDGNKSRDENGNCTQAYRDDYNAVSVPFKELQDAQAQNRLTPQEEIKRAKDIREACLHFFARHAGIACRARNNGEVKTIRSTRLRSKCEHIENQLNSVDSGGDTNVPGAPPSDGGQGDIHTLRPDLEGVKVQETMALFKAEITQPEQFVKMAENDKTASVYGHVYDQSSLATIPKLDEATVCTMAYSPAPGAEPFKQGQAFETLATVEKTSTSDDKTYRVLTLNLQAGLVATCMKSYTTEAGFLWSEVQISFGDILKFSKKL